MGAGVMAFFALNACDKAKKAPSVQLPSLSIDGSSTVYPISEAVARAFEKTGKAEVTVVTSGTSSGFRKFCNGNTLIQDASRPMTEQEIDLCKKNLIQFMELPIAYDGIAVVVNQGNEWVTTLSIEQLKKMWEPAARGNVTTWQQVDPDWPNEAFVLYGPGIASGTYDYFTEAVVGEQHSSRADFNSSENDNDLVRSIYNNRNGLGYFGYAYYAENKNKVKLIPISSKGTNGTPVAPSPETVTNGTYQPLSRPLFIYVNQAAVEKHPVVRELIEFYLKNAPRLVEEAGYIPLSDNGYAKVLRRFQGGVTGSVFAGSGAKVGITQEDLMKLEDPGAPGRAPGKAVDGTP